MEALIVPLLGLIGKLVEMGAQAYADSKKKHEDIVKAYYDALATVPGLMEGLIAHHAARKATVDAAIADASAKQAAKTIPAPTPVPEE